MTKKIVVPVKERNHKLATSHQTGLRRGLRPRVGSRSAVSPFMARNGVNCQVDRTGNHRQVPGARIRGAVTTRGVGVAALPFFSIDCESIKSFRLIN